MKTYASGTDLADIKGLCSGYSKGEAAADGKETRERLLIQRTAALLRRNLGP